MTTQKNRFDTLSGVCSKATTKLYSTSFSLGISYLSKTLRQPIYNIYGFVRLADEIVDSFHQYDKSALLAEFRTDTFNSIERGISLNPVLNAFQQTVNHYQVNHELIDLFLKSMEMDLHAQHYTQEKYSTYILGSAQVVGLMCLHVFLNGDHDEYERLKQSAMQLGSAFQKVNFLRDISSDYYELNRSYFPQVIMSSFTDADKKVIEQEIKEEFANALVGIRQLPQSCRKGVYLAYVYYYNLFLKIKFQPAGVIMSERIRISNRRKLLLMFDSLVRCKLNIL